jgi:hypothetical protein
MNLTGERYRIDNPDPFDAEVEILPDLLEGFSGRVFGRKNLDAQVRRPGDNTASELATGLSVMTQTSGTRK